MKRILQPASLFVIAGLMLAAQGGCSKPESVGARGGSARTVDVRVHTVQEEVVARKVQGVGSLHPLDESTISSEVEGRIEKVHADVGDQVAQGQPLVTISPVELSYELERQRAAVQQVRARLGIGPADPLPRDPARVAFVQRAAADMFDAHQKHQRAVRLFEDKLISQQQLDEAAARFKSAQASYDVALQEVEQLKAQLLSGESSVKLAEKKLADTSIRAPFPGTVKERRVSAGEYLRVQSPVAVIVRTDQLRARMEVPEKWAGAVRAGAPVEITVDAFPGEVFRAQVTRISPSVSQETRTFLVEALLANRDARLKPGFFVQASIASDLREKALFVPEKAVFYRYGVYKVFVVGEGEKLEEREVKTGTQEATRIEILEGLKPGNRVAMAVKGEITAGATARQVSP